MADPVACDVCRRRQLDSECCRMGLLRRRTRIRRSADGVDHISALPDDMLLQVLARLGCARAVAHTGVLSSRWRGLWARLPELTFHSLGPETLHVVLTKVALPVGSLKIILPGHHKLSSARILDLLHTIASLEPAELEVDIREDLRASGDKDIIELPRFDRTTSITLEFDPRLSRWLTLLVPHGGFMVLESLSLCGCHIGIEDLLKGCPRLRKLWIDGWQFDSVTVHSPTLEELDLSNSVQLRSLNINAPILKTANFNAVSLDNDFTLTFSAPLVENLSWRCDCRSTWDRFGLMWFVQTLDLRKTKGCMSCPRETLLLYIGATDDLGDVARSFEQEISRHPVTNISCLSLSLATKGHAYGPMLLDLLGLCSSVQNVTVRLNLFDEVVKTCSANCPCNQPDNWRSRIISLTDLKEVYIGGFRGEEHEICLLKALLICAAMLEKVTIYFSRNVPQNCTAYMELPTISKAYPSVKFNIFRCGKQFCLDD